MIQIGYRHKHAQTDLRSLWPQLPFQKWTSRYARTMSYHADSRRFIQRIEWKKFSPSILYEILLDRREGRFQDVPKTFHLVMPIKTSFCRKSSQAENLL
jgi:hypothetical protein